MDKRDLHTPFEEIRKIDEETEKGKPSVGDLLVEILQELYSVQKEQKDQVSLIVVLQVSIVCLLAVLIWFA